MSRGNNSLQAFTRRNIFILECTHNRVSCSVRCWSTNGPLPHPPVTHAHIMKVYSTQVASNTYVIMVVYNIQVAASLTDCCLHTVTEWKYHSHWLQGLDLTARRLIAGGVATSPLCFLRQSGNHQETKLYSTIFFLNIFICTDVRDSSVLDSLSECLEDDYDLSSRSKNQESCVLAMSLPKG